jgi:two-component system LytT family response regulator
LPRAEWTALIADDEPAARRGVRQLLAAFPEFAVVGECRNGAEVLAALKKSKPDVVFLDIQMPGIDGFDVIRQQAAERMPAVVFLTAYDQFAVRAFEAQALDYLVKPVTEARFAATVKRLVRHLRTVAPAIREETIVVTTSKGSTVLHVRDIDWIEADGNYARLWIGERSYLIREPIQLLEKRMCAHDFIRAHRQALVRLDRVRAVTWTGSGPAAVLDCGVRIPIARRRRAAFVAALRAR